MKKVYLSSKHEFNVNLSNSNKSLYFKIVHKFSKKQLYAPFQQVKVNKMFVFINKLHDFHKQYYELLHLYEH